MIEVKIQDYVGTKKELTAEQVRKLPVGARVLLHSFDRHGEHSLDGDDNRKEREQEDIDC